MIGVFVGEENEIEKYISGDLLCFEKTFEKNESRTEVGRVVGIDQTKVHITVAIGRLEQD
jgi:hypothetical protein